MLQRRRYPLMFGMIFGAWLGFTYAFVTQAVNMLYLPEIPLEPTGGSLPLYLAQFSLLGAILGLASTLPENRMAGMALGGLTAAVLVTLAALFNAVTSEMVGLTLLTILFLFLPMVVLMMPIAYVIRVGVDAQETDPSRPHLWARRYLMPGLMTLLVVVIASFSLHAPEVRQAFRTTQVLIETGMRASSEADLPEPLLDARGFLDSAQAPYRMSWTDRVDTFFGPRPVGAELSQFLIVTRFSNGYAVACLYSNNRGVPTCTNHR